MTEELKPCPAGHANPRICREHLTTSRYGFGVTCRTKDCGWEVVPLYDDIDTAAAAWNTRAESEVYGTGWAVKTKWNSVPHIFHDQRDAERFAYNEKSEVIKVKYVRDE